MSLLQSINVFALTLFVSHTVCGVANSQNTNISTSSEFEKIFKKETLTDSINSPVIIGVGVEVLPSWFFNPSQGSLNEFLVTGISDPGMDRTLAKKLAIERASFLASLMTETQVRGVTDNFTGSSGSKFEEVIKFSGASIHCKMEIIDSTFTRFNEAVVLCKVIIDTLGSTEHTAILESYKSQIKTETGWQLIEKVSMSAKRDSNVLVYQYLKDGNDFTVFSFFNKQPYPVPLGIYEYSEIAESGNDQVAKYPHTGLWMGYLQALCASISVKASNLKSATKSVDQFEQGNSNTNINRNVSKNKFSFSIKNIKIVENKLNVEILLSK